MKRPFKEEFRTKAYENPTAEQYSADAGPDSYRDTLPLKRHYFQVKSNLQKLGRRLNIAVAAIALTMLAGACSKSSSNNNNTNANAAYLGTFIGSHTDGAGTYADTMVITAGSSSSAIVMSSRTSTGSDYVIDGTVSGNSMAVASQQVYISIYNTTYTVTGSGALTGSTLTTSTTYVSPANVSTHWSFTGTKQ